MVNKYQKSIDYLKQLIMQGKYGLQCLDEDGESIYLDGKGHLFSICFMAEAIADDLSELERTILLTRLISEEVDGLWGYAPRGYRVTTENKPFLEDSDDTAFAIRAFKALGVYKNPKQLLSFYKKDEGGFSTFKVNKLSAFTENQTLEGHYAMHPEVNANVLYALHGSDYELAPPDNLLKLWKKGDGSYHTYFYPGSYYALFNFMQYLVKFESHWHLVKEGVNFVLSTQNADGSWGNNAMDTALALLVLKLGSETGNGFVKGRAYLTANCNDDGAWNNTDFVWWFYDAQSNKHWKAYDNNFAITTALCVQALKAT